MSRKIRIALIGDSFYSWGGGIDFLLNIAKVLLYQKERNNNIEFFLLLPKKCKIVIELKVFRSYIKNYNISKNFSKTKEEKISEMDNIINSFSQIYKDTEIIFYNKFAIKDINDNGYGLSKVLKEMKMDICFPIADKTYKNFPIPWIGYMYDFQHKYLKNLFSKNEKKIRDKRFEKQIMNSRYILVNSQDVKKDIEKYFPQNKCKVFVLPFLPILSESWINNNEVIIRKFDLPKKYFIVSNQFWMHKSHMTAFKALEHIYNKGYKDIHIVCTGKMDDSRNKNYCKMLLEKISKLKSNKNIHFTGYISKLEQIQIMKNSIALVQPTLFEGGPGGGSVYDALCLGIPCIVSDIDVNLEIMNNERVLFFKAKNARSLAKRFLYMINNSIERPSEDELINIMKKNKEEYGKYLINMIQEVIKNY